MQHLGAPGFYPVSTPESPLPKLLLVAPSANLDNVTSDFLNELGFNLVTVSSAPKACALAASPRACSV